MYPLDCRCRWEKQFELYKKQFESRMLDQACRPLDHGSGIRDPASVFLRRWWWTQDLEFLLLDHGSSTVNLGCWIHDHGSCIQGPGSRIWHPRSRTLTWSNVLSEFYPFVKQFSLQFERMVAIGVEYFPHRRDRIHLRDVLACPGARAHFTGPISLRMTTLPPDHNAYTASHGALLAPFFVLNLAHASSTLSLMESINSPFSSGYHYPSIELTRRPIYIDLLWPANGSTGRGIKLYTRPI